LTPKYRCFRLPPNSRGVPMLIHRDTPLCLFNWPGLSLYTQSWLFCTLVISAPKYRRADRWSGNRPPLRACITRRRPCLALGQASLSTISRDNPSTGPLGLLLRPPPQPLYVCAKYRLGHSNVNPFVDTPSSNLCRLIDLGKCLPLYCCYSRGIRYIGQRKPAKYTSPSWTAR